MKKLYLLIAAMMVATFACAQTRLPNITLKDGSGNDVRLDTLSNNGKPIVVAFFATWCKPCNRELKAIDEVYSDWQQETGVKIVAVSIDQAQNINKVKPLVDENGWTYQVLLDPNGELKRAMGVQMIPYTLLLDGKGNIVYKHNGYTDGAETELFQKVKDCL
ncbi:MAG: TlpA family protein disulfide reductase [Prevotella sp.]